MHGEKLNFKHSIALDTFSDLSYFCVTLSIFFTFNLTNVVELYHLSV